MIDKGLNKSEFAEEPHFFRSLYKLWRKSLKLMCYSI